MARRVGSSKSKGGKSSSPAIRKEARCWGMGAIGILLLVAVLIPDRVGVVGRFVHGLLLGAFGFGGVVLPIAFICFAVFGLISKEARFPFVRGIITAWLALAWLHIIFFRLDESYTGIEYLRAVYNSGRLLGGGVLGAFLGNLFVTALGVIPSIIAISILIVILLIFITGRSFTSLISRGVDKARDLYDERAARNDDYFDDDEAQELKPPLKTKKKNPAELKPLAERRKDHKKVNQRADLIDIDAANSSEDEEYTVLLVQEELDNVRLGARGAQEIAPFLRDGRHRKRSDNPRVLTFDGSGEQFFEDTAEPQAYTQDFAEDNVDDYSQDYFDDEGNTPFVVRGLVDGAEMSPLFEYDEDSDPVEYDEYTHVSRLAGADPQVLSADAMQATPAEPNYEDFELPPLDLLAQNSKPGAGAESRMKVLENSHILEETLRSFRIEAKVVEVSVGPTVTRYDLAPGPGVKVSSIANLSNDLALSLAAQGIRIEAPIPGKSAVGIEIPNKEPQGVFLREIIECERFENFPSKLAFAVGKDIAGNPVVADVADMPHLLIAGATGAGKSVCINTLIASLLYKARPDEVKLLMIDPKVVELSVYNGIPHLLIPVVTDPKKASGALNWAVQEMESRYNAFAETGCRDLKGYNRHLSDNDEQSLPQIVIIIDELADLMMTCKGEVEEAICRLAQKARAAGIHLIVATQRPSVDVITGLIKANIPSRLAFAVSSGTDSRTVLDMHGAEKLLGRGDMLFLPRGQSKPIRVQGGFISDKEVEQLVAFLKAQAPAEHTTEMIQQVTMPGKTKIEGELDEFFHDAVDFLLVKGKASTSMLQRQFRIGYNRASRLMDDLEVRGIVGPEDGVKPRKVTITREEYREIYGE